MIHILDIKWIKTKLHIILAKSQKKIKLKKKRWAKMAYYGPLLEKEGKHV
jgi:hypothetical protein